MKRILLLMLPSIIFAQSNYYIPDSNQVGYGFKQYEITNVAATCASPNGPMNSIGAPPGSYAALQTGGYCNPNTYPEPGTVCWTFTPTGNSITINSGYSTSGCGSITFGPFSLYTCAPACTFLGSGLNFTVVPGQCYTWCMTYSGTGPFCTFNDFCPYYTQTVTPLPVDLVSFTGYSHENVNILEFEVKNVKNCDYYEIEYSDNAQNWEYGIKIKSIKDVTRYRYDDYNYKKLTNYYRLKQVDYDGTYKYYKIIAIDNRYNKTIMSIRLLDILGRDVSNLLTPGIYIKHTTYSDSTIELKKIIIK